MAECDVLKQIQVFEQQDLGKELAAVLTEKCFPYIGWNVNELGTLKKSKVAK